MTEFQGAVKPDSISVDSYEPLLYAKRVMDVPNNLQMRVEYNADGTELYVGYGARGLAAGTTGWLLYKYTHVNQQVTLKQTAYDSWDNRAAATYA